jgi:hypothetical protein
MSMQNGTEIAVGNIVKLRPEWCERGEESGRYVVVELRGPRVLIRYICDLPIPPTESVEMRTIELAE